MATTTTTTSLALKLTTIIFLLFISIHTRDAFLTDEDVEDVDEEYVLDAPFGSSGTHRTLRSRFLASTIKKGAKCSAYNNVCNGVSANNGSSLLHCCKKHCRNIYGDRNNCGGCGNKCRLDQRCCNGACTNVGYNPSNCGKCGNTCAAGLKCTYGFCGYA